MIKINANTKFTLICFALMSYFTLHKVYAQKQNEYTLLWEITGKDLSKPSYLFGVMNIRDIRSFNFSDSVYIALSNSTAFAVEIHPDTTIKSMIEFGYNTPKMANLINQGYPTKKIDVNKQTLPNAYLYGLARTYRKKIFGLDNSITTDQAYEKVSDSEDEEEDDDDEAEQEILDHFMSVYSGGKLNDIWDEIQHYSEGESFLHRTQILTKNLIELLSNERVFTSVGIAFLPGEHGMISLLEKAGYKLRPVGGSFTKLADNYQIDVTKKEWFEFKDEINHSKVDFPGTPHQVQKESGSNVWAYIDPVTSTLYRTISTFIGPLINSTPRAYIDTLLNNQINIYGNTLVKSDYVEKFGSTMLIAELKNGEQTNHSHFIYTNGTIYMFSVIYYAGITDLKAKEIFLNSIQINKPTAISPNDWITYKNEAGAFSIKLPLSPFFKKSELPNSILPESPMALVNFIATDKANNMNYLIQYKDYPAGVQILDKNLVFKSLIEELSFSGTLISPPSIIFKDGYEGRTVDILLNNTYLETQTYLKGNRIYLLIKQNLEGPTKGKNDSFLESFNFLPNLSANNAAFKVGNIELFMPTKPLLITKNKKSEDEEDLGTSFIANNQTYSAANPYSAGIYLIEKGTISKYYKSPDIDSVYKIFEPFYTTDKTVLDHKNIIIGKQKAKEIISYDSLTNLTARSIIWFHENNFYTQTLMGTKEEVYTEQANQFFNPKINTEGSLFDFKQSKAKLIVQDLASKDKETRKFAKGALAFYDFEPDELSYIYTALGKEYEDDTTVNGVKEMLLNNFFVLKDKNTSTFLKQLYKNNKGKDLIQSKILTILPHADKNSYSWYLKTLVETRPLKLENYWQLFSPMIDSLSFAAANHDQLLKLMEISEYRPMILNVFNNMLDSDNIDTYQPLLVTKNQLISKYALEDLELDFIKFNDSNEVHNTNIPSYLRLLPKLNLANLTDTYTEKVMISESPSYLRTLAIATRIMNNLEVSSEILTEQLDSLHSRYEIMLAFNEVGKLNEIPNQYKEHKEFAKLIMYNHLMNEYYPPLSVQLIDSLVEDDLTYYVFDFIYEIDGKQESYIGVSGPFNNQKDVLNFKDYYAVSNFDLKNDDWLKIAKELIKEFK